MCPLLSTGTVDSTSEKKRVQTIHIVSYYGEREILPNKMEELMAQTRLQREYWECNLMCFTETQLMDLPVNAGKFSTAES